MALLLLAIPACSSGRPPAAVPPTGSVVRVASFAFPESTTVAEIYARTLEAGGVPVERVLNLASREVVEPAVEQGKVDVVPEYLGTSLAFVEPGVEASGKSSAELYDQARQAYAQRGITVLPPAPGQNQNGVVVTRATAERLHLKKISDLVPVAPELRFGGPAECPERPFCLQGLRTRYGLHFRDFVPLDAGGLLTLGALESQTVDVALLFTSDGHLATDEFRLLADDRHLQPAENLYPMVRTDALARYRPVLAERLNQVSALLTTPELVALNRRVELEGVSPAQAAGDWLRLRGLV